MNRAHDCLQVPDTLKQRHLGTWFPWRQLAALQDRLDAAEGPAAAAALQQLSASMEAHAQTTARLSERLRTAEA